MFLDRYFFTGKDLLYSSKNSFKNAAYDSVGSFFDSVDCQSQLCSLLEKDSRDFFVIFRAE